MASSVLTCWTKLSCLFDVEAQKSSRTITRCSRSLSPSAFTTVIDERADQRSWREVLPGSGLNVFGVLFKQPFIGVALNVGVEREPGLAVDQVDDQPPQLGRILNPVLRFAEDDAEHPGSPAELG